ncbi:MAG: NrfD/PsrC family molybdoenzyme membrane anchor subunit [Terriglobales bacterium]
MSEAPKFPPDLFPDPEAASRNVDRATSDRQGQDRPEQDHPALDRKERRLAIIQREAAAQLAKPQTPSLPVASADVGYYGLPMLKQPTWTWEVPLYLFVGGAAGSAALIATMARITGASPRLVRDARRISFAGSILSPALLIADLGRPARFAAMLRVFKPQSPMSVGVWILSGFGGATTAARLGAMLRARGLLSTLAWLLENAGDFGALLLGPPLASYTGVLIGATVIPAWNRNVTLLPVHFAASGVGAATGMLELAGHSEPALQYLGLAAAAAETAAGAHIESRKDPKLAPLKRGGSGWLIRLGGLLSGPVPLALRVACLFAGRKRNNSLRKYAAASAVAGSLITRVAWVHAGSVSARESRPSD